MPQKPPARWNPSKASPFARNAFPPGGGYRPQSVQETTGVNAFGAPSVPIGQGPVPQSNPGPPVSWQGQWRPSEAELARWGGRVVLYGKAVPDNAETVGEVDLLDATLPWPMGCDCVTVVETLGPVAWGTDVIVSIRSGIGRAGWQVSQRVKPLVGEPIIVTFTRQPFRQVNVRASWGSAPAAGEILAVSFGFGLVGL